MRRETEEGRRGVKRGQRKREEKEGERFALRSQQLKTLRAPCGERRAGERDEGQRPTWQVNHTRQTLPPRPLWHSGKGAGAGGDGRHVSDSRRQLTGQRSKVKPKGGTGNGARMSPPRSSGTVAHLHSGESALPEIKYACHSNTVPAESSFC